MNLATWRACPRRTGPCRRARHAAHARARRRAAAPAVGALKDAWAPGCTPSGGGGIPDDATDECAAERDALRRVILACCVWLVWALIGFGGAWFVAARAIYARGAPCALCACGRGAIEPPVRGARAAQRLRAAALVRAAGLARRGRSAVHGQRGGGGAHAPLLEEAAPRATTRRRGREQAPAVSDAPLARGGAFSWGLRAWTAQPRDGGRGSHTGAIGSTRKGGRVVRAEGGGGVVGSEDAAAAARRVSISPGISRRVRAASVRPKGASRADSAAAAAGRGALLSPASAPRSRGFVGAPWACPSAP